MSEELRHACFELARVTNWDMTPVDTAAIQTLSDSFYEIAMDQESASLNIDTALLAQAVGYLAHAHAIPPMQNDTSWFYNMLIAVFEITRPNRFVPDDKPFLKEMLYDIAESLSAC
ncbi:hypothetical protein [Bradyrhizobium sp. Bra64]|uniref:hypothetical protein n=1 Tax=Bradyrhizobium sp. Bra64 TaxID=2926009 RepID=UPI002118D33B|nr:hypothetical protein [Bradyrhizobium sp. Bra64]